MTSVDVDEHRLMAECCLNEVSISEGLFSALPQIACVTLDTSVSSTVPQYLTEIIIFIAGRGIEVLRGIITYFCNIREFSASVGEKRSRNSLDFLVGRGFFATTSQNLPPPLNTNAKMHSCFKCQTLQRLL